MSDQAKALIAPRDEVLTPAATAALLYVSVQTLATWRCKKRYDLPYHKVGSKVVYLRGEVEEFLNRHRVDR